MRITVNFRRPGEGRLGKGFPKIGSLFLYMSLLLAMAYFAPPATAQQQRIDSLLQVIDTLSNTNTRKVDVLNKIGFAYAMSDLEKVELYAQKAMALAQEQGYKSGIAHAYQTMAVSMYKKGEYDSAIAKYQKSYEINIEANNIKGMASALGNTAVIYEQQGKYLQALDIYEDIIVMFREEGDMQAVSVCYNNMAQVCKNINREDDAVEYYQKAMELSDSLGDQRGIAYASSNIGGFYSKDGNRKKAEEYYQRALQISEEIGDLKGIYLNSSNLAKLYVALGKNGLAERNFRRALGITQENEDRHSQGIALRQYADFKQEQGQIGEALQMLNRAIAIQREIRAEGHLTFSLISLAQLQRKRNRLYEANKAAEEALTIARAIGSLKAQEKGLMALYKIQEEQGKTQQALRNLEIALELRDSIYSLDKAERVANLQNMIELERQEAENQILKEKEAKNAALIAQQQQQLYGLVAGIALVALLSAQFYRGRQKQKKANHLLQEKNTAIEQQKEELKVQSERIQENNHEISQINEELNTTIETIQIQKQEIEEQNKSILASVNYAQRIQQAAMPSSQEIARFFPQHFLLYLPRDVVSGDFYWAKAISETKTMLVVGDCTGHGVPGAFMSMICIDLLQEIASRQYNRADSPAEVLTWVDQQVRSRLGQEEEGGKSQDGMDCTCCLFDWENKAVTFASAKRPVLYIQNGEIQQIKGSRASIGGKVSEREGKRSFANEELSFQESELLLYLFSDGYPDQFGGKSNKKFGSKGLRNLIFENQGQSMPAQHQNLHQVITNWMREGGEAQIDDITVMGIRLG